MATQDEELAAAEQFVLDYLNREGGEHPLGNVAIAGCLERHLRAEIVRGAIAILVDTGRIHMTDALRICIKGLKRKTPTNKQLYTLWQYAQKYIHEHHITGAEAVYQCDHISLSALAFIEGLGEIVGWFTYPEDDKD